MTTILVAGASGFLGRKITLELANHGSFKVRAIYHSSDLRKKEIFEELKKAGVDLVEADYDDIGSLKIAMIGVSVIVSALSRDAVLQGQINLILAAKEVGSITRFIPSEFGADIPEDLNGTFGEEVYSNKIRIRKALVESGIPYTIIINGVFLDYVFTSFLGFNIENKSVTIIEDGNYPIIALHTDDLAKYVPRVILDSGSLNKKVYLVGDTRTANELVTLLEDVFKQTFTKQNMSFEELENKCKTQEGLIKFSSINQRFLYLGNGKFPNPINHSNNELYLDIKPKTFLEQIKSW